MYRLFVLLAVMAAAAQGEPSNSETNAFVEGAKNLCRQADVPEYLKATSFLFQETLKAGNDPNPAVLDQKAEALTQMLLVARWIHPKMQVRETEAIKKLKAAANNLKGKGMNRETKLNRLKQAFQQVEEAAKYALPLENLVPLQMRPGLKALKFGSMNPQNR